MRFVREQALARFTFDVTQCFLVNTIFGILIISINFMNFSIVPRKLFIKKKKIGNRNLVLVLFSNSFDDHVYLKTKTISLIFQLIFSLLDISNVIHFTKRILWL